MTSDELSKILDLHAKWLRSEEGGSRAYLIAAAPEMLEALRKVARMHALLEQLASAYRGSLPHEMAGGEFVSGNPELSADTRTRLALIEDIIAKADAITIEADNAVGKAEGRES